MLVDCRTCPGRGRTCGDCALAPLLTGLPGLPLDDEEIEAVALFADLGLVSQGEAASARARHEPVRLARAAG